MASEEVIFSRSRLSQVKDFRNLKIDGYTPTDIDFAYDKAGRQFVFGELKLEGVPVPAGQLRLLRGLAWALGAAGRDTCVLVASHATDPDEDIDVGNLLVVASWHTNGTLLEADYYVGRTVQQACVAFFEDKG